MSAGPATYDPMDTTDPSTDGQGAQPTITPTDVAGWMLGQLEAGDWLTQEYAVAEISRRFGEEFVYLNDNGNPAIDKRILRAFRKLTEDTVIWDRWEFAWRKRTTSDGPTRKQE